MDKQKVAAFAERVFGDIGGFFAIGMAYLGVKTGLLAAMAAGAPMTLDGVIRETGLQPKYVEAWLKGMVSAEYLEYDPAAETYRLPEEHAYLLASEGSDHYLGGIFYQAQANMAVAERLAEAFLKGGGVPFEDYGTDNLIGLDLANKGIYEHRFASYWLKAVPAVVASLEGGGRALDVGCGMGSVPLALARAFPAAHMVGVDLDQESIRRARASAAAKGLGDRVHFAAQPLEELEPGEPFDLITACDVVHDLAQPLAVLGEIKARLAPDGTFFVVEPKVADRLEDNLNPVATMYHGFSLFH